MKSVLFLSALILCTNSYADSCYCQCAQKIAGGIRYCALDKNTEGKELFWSQKDDAPRGSCGQQNSTNDICLNGKDCRRRNCTHARPSELR